MIQQELDKRNEAIALFDGWEKWDPVAELPNEFHTNPTPTYFKDDQPPCKVSGFWYQYSANHLMPVAEKMLAQQIVIIQRQSPLLGFEVEVSWGESPNIKRITRTHELLKQAYFMAVSDYCLSIQKT